LAGFEARADEIAGEIAAATVAEVGGFGSGRNTALHDEIRTLARHHLAAFLHAVRTGGPPSPEVLAAARERAVSRAREMVPLAALLHSYLIAQRVISAAIAAEAGADAKSRGSALQLTAKTFDYNIAVTTAMADAYVEAVQGDLAELEAARRELVDALLRAGSQPGAELTRRAIGLGLDPAHWHVVVMAVADTPQSAGTGSQRRVAEAMAQASGRPRRSAFVVIGHRAVIAVLDANGAHDARAVLDRASAAMSQAGGGLLRAGVGTSFTGLGGFETSYQVPDAIRQALGDPTVRGTLQVFVEADLNVAATAKALSLHPNSLRYRLGRITELTGRDPRKLTDLLELIAATHVLTGQTGRDT
jgi:hypothetical protein